MPVIREFNAMGPDMVVEIQTMGTPWEEANSEWIQD